MSFLGFKDESKLPKTLGELKKSPWKSRSVKSEIRENLILKLKNKETLFDGILGYEHTVEEQIINALLSEHNFILLGLRGQGKTKIIRQIVHFLDPYTPVLKGSLLNEDPFNPISAWAKKTIKEKGDATAITWLAKEDRFKEKLATPDVSIADLIGDLDPIKAVREKLDLSNEEVIHWGIIPRSNRGIFAINELSDLQPRIQVGLFNILEEKDIQVRGFPLRIPMDILLLFSANPEDYTNRGRIVTPLKDRINSQIITHYPKTVEIAKKITKNEIDIKTEVVIPEIIYDTAERIAFVARESDLVDPTSGVSQRLSIAALELIAANAQRRTFLYPNSEKKVRWMDIYAAVGAITGKIELIEERHQDDLIKVGVNFIGQAARATFDTLFPALGKNIKRNIEISQEAIEEDLSFDNFDKKIDTRFLTIIDFFKKGGRLELSDEMDDATFSKNLAKVDGLEKIATEHADKNDVPDVPLMMEILLDGLFQYGLVNRKMEDGCLSFYDVYSSMMDNLQ